MLKEWSFWALMTWWGFDWRWSWRILWLEWRSIIFLFLFLVIVRVIFFIRSYLWAHRFNDKTMFQSTVFCRNRGWCNWASSQSIFLFNLSWLVKPWSYRCLFFKRFILFIWRISLTFMFIFFSIQETWSL